MKITPMSLNRDEVLVTLDVSVTVEKPYTFAGENRIWVSTKVDEILKEYEGQNLFFLAAHRIETRYEEICTINAACFVEEMALAKFQFEDFDSVHGGCSVYVKTATLNEDLDKIESLINRQYTSIETPFEDLCKYFWFLDGLWKSLNCFIENGLEPDDKDSIAYLPFLKVFLREISLAEAKKELQKVESKIKDWVIAHKDLDISYKYGSLWAKFYNEIKGEK